MDSRAIPHTVYIFVGLAERQRLLVIEKAAERIALADLRAALPVPVLHAQTRQAAPA